MQIDHAGREYVTFNITGDLTGITGYDISIDGTTWLPLTQVGTTNDWRILVAGPDAVSNPAGTLALTAGQTAVVSIRATGTPEVIIRDNLSTIAVH